MCSSPRTEASGPLRILLLALGSLCVGLGLLGIFLPLLPTTPFLLLAAACYARSSRRFHRWLQQNRLCGPYLHRYRSGQGMSLYHKTGSLLLLWTGIGLTLWRVTLSWWLVLMLLLVALAVSTHLLRLPTWRRQANSCDTR